MSRIEQNKNQSIRSAAIRKYKKQKGNEKGYNKAVL